MDTPVPRSAASTVPDAAADPGTSEPDGVAAPGAPAVPAPSRRGVAPAVLLAVMVVAGVLLTVSRFVVFEGTNGYHAVDLGWSTVTWVVQVLLPLVLAAGVLLAGAGSPVSTALAGGLVAGVTISLVSQLLMFLGIYLDPDVGYRIGPAWWLILAAVVLLGVGVAVVATVCLGDRPHRRRNRRSAAAAVLVVGSAVAWAISGDVSIDFGWRVFLQFAGLLLCVAGLPVAVLDLDERQRLFGLAAVTTTGAWLVTVAVETLVVHPPGYQPRALTSAVIATFATVGGAWLGQWRSKAPRPAAGG
jgi:MFS family permease